SDHGRDHPALDAEAHALEGARGLTWILNVHPGKGDHVSRRSVMRKNGTPTSAVIAPSGRAMCGTTSPTKPTSPAAATVAAATSDAVTYTRRVARSTSTPSPAAE